MASHDIMRGSPAWERIQSGIPPEVSDIALRRMFHDYSNVLTPIVNTVNELMDENARLHERIDRRGDDINALGKVSQERHDKLVHRLYDSEEGTLPTLAKKTDVSRLTVLFWGILVSITTAAVMLALNLVATKGGS